MTFVPARSTLGAGFRVHSPDDWSVLRASHPNLLITGPRDATHAFVLAAIPLLLTPVHECSACDASLLQPASGTLILRDVDGLDREQQQRLLRWLEDAPNGQTQVISLTAAPLYAAVQTGMFLSNLYYRLNVVCFEVSQLEGTVDPPVSLPSSR